jgi:polyisoprenoid-binding protein YceI
MELGPENARLTVRTGRGGAAAKAGHDLLIEVTRWRGKLEDGALELEADPRSLRVVEGTGGISELDEGDKAGIAQTIDEEILKGAPIVFRSTRVARSAARLDVEGELELVGVRRPLGFVLAVGDDGRITGSARIKQTDWGIKPYSALFGTLKVVDEIDVEIDGRLPA